MTAPRRTAIAHTSVGRTVMAHPLMTRMGWGLIATALALTAYVTWDNWGDTWRVPTPPTSKAHSVTTPAEKTAQIERGQ